MTNNTMIVSTRKRPFFIWLLVLVLFALPMTSYGDETPNHVPPNPHIGVVDVNTGLETAHVSLTPDQIGYKFLDANYRQAQNVGASWNRWKVDWSAVERQASDFPSLAHCCRNGMKP